MDLNKWFLVCSTSILFSMVFGNSNECKDSAVTAKIVKSCPKTLKEWRKAAEMKGCEKMSHSCSSFEYHCVINAWGNEAIEVCAPKLKIIGKVCAEYSQGGKRIQRNGSKHCKTCPVSYSSNESFKYQECYEYVTNAKISYTQHVETVSMDIESTTEKIADSSSSSDFYEESSRKMMNIDLQSTSSYIIIIIIICVVIGVVAVAIIITVKQRFLANKICILLKRTVLKKEDEQNIPTDIISNVEEAPEVQNHLLVKKVHTQDEFYESNESSDKSNFNAFSS